MFLTVDSYTILNHLCSNFHAGNFCYVNVLFTCEGCNLSISFVETFPVTCGATSYYSKYSFSFPRPREETCSFWCLQSAMECFLS